MGHFVAVSDITDEIIKQFLTETEAVEVLLSRVDSDIVGACGRVGVRAEQIPVDANGRATVSEIIDYGLACLGERFFVDRWGVGTSAANHDKYKIKIDLYIYLKRERARVISEPVVLGVNGNAMMPESRLTHSFMLRG